MKTEATEDGVTITVPTTAPDPICSVVVCRIDGAPDVTPYAIAPGKDGSITLPAAEATLHGEGLRYESGDQRDNIGFWTNADENVEWQFRVAKAGQYKVTATIASLASAKFEVTAGTAKATGTAPNTGDYGKFETVDVGTIELAAGTATLAVKPVKDGWQAINLKAVTLTPAK